MTKCPNCGNTLKEPIKTLKNHVFQIDAYTCGSCGYQFKESREIFSA